MLMRDLKKGQEMPGMFHLPGGIPDEYYAFTDGQVSCTVERNGGINTIGCLDILERNGKLYPDRGNTPIIFLKEGQTCGKRPLYGPAVQFISTNKSEDGTSGRNLFHTPDHLDLYPFGFKSESLRFGHRTSYDLAIVGTDVLLGFTNTFPTRDKFVVAIGKDHIFQGTTYSLKNQLAEGSIETARAVGIPLLSYFSKNPLADGAGSPANPLIEENFRCEQKWDFIGFDPECNGFVLEGALKFAYGDKPVVVLLTADRPLGFSQTESRYFLETQWRDDLGIHFCLTIGATRSAVSTHAREILARFETIFSAKISESISYAESRPILEASDFPDVRTFSRTAPSFLKAMTLAQTEREICIRGATHKFGFFCLWDQVWCAKAFALMGDWETAKKLLRYPISLLTGWEKKQEVIYLAMFAITIAEDIIATSGDWEFESEVYGELKRLFLIHADRAGKNGMLAATGACGVDDPREVGITGDVYPSCLNSLWFDACRAMENFALRAGDGEIAGLAHARGKLIDENYLDAFFDPSVGYLSVAVDAGTGRQIPIYQNVVTLGMDFPYGEYLLRSRLGEIARFQAFQLYHPAGRSAVAYRDRAHEMWRNCIMYQHLAHEMRTARAADLGDEINRMMAVYMGHFRRNKVAIETHNLVGAEGDITQRANWQNFGTRALYSGIVEGLMGIQCDYGGIGYVPCDMTGAMSISDLRFRRGSWEIQLNGAGPAVAEFNIDGSHVAGTMKVPADYLADDRSHRLAITRGPRPFDRPTLLSAPGAAICKLESTVSRLSFAVNQPVHTSCKFTAPNRPTLDLDGRSQPVEWNSHTKVGWCDLHLTAGQRLTISCEDTQEK